MGNHEWCEDCHRSDFHYGEPCNPADKAKVDARKAERLRRSERADAAAKHLTDELNRAGIPAHFQASGSYIQINKWDLVDV